jgi:hypothetical protein
MSKDGIRSNSMQSVFNCSQTFGVALGEECGAETIGLAFAVVGAVALGPDLVRYMKIRAM